MRMVDLIIKKRDSYTHTKEEIEFIVKGVTDETIPDYQITAWLMAVFFKGMSDKEVADLTLAMLESGDKMDLSSIPGIKVDKHSTGGVGDTTTLVLAPLVAAAGIPVAKISGRGLGHTGGTLDKLESIPGVTTALSIEDLLKQVRDIGVAVAGQTANLTPADKHLYSLRDVTGTVDSIPLILASVMSKKIASGADCLVLDVKVGSGAFMKKLEHARKLARSMVNIGTLMKRKTAALITDMDQPLGMAIGNALEVMEALEILRGEISSSPLKEVSLTLGAYMLLLAGACENIDKGKERLQKLISNGMGARKMEQLIEAQKGDPKVVEDPYLLPQAKYISSVLSPVDGYLQSVNTEEVGRAAMILGAGRERKSDRIDPSVGIWLKKRIGDKIQKGDPIAVIHSNDKDKTEDSGKCLLDAYKMGDEKPEEIPLIIDIIGQ
ncbi:MAG: Pyrimidine-nucleoside phosphorylase [bacterium ADurb.Bin363]|nr:MAG: Pyrimidine-nucleoside phosphorylase [bacterium ADurb.Bin363]